MAYTVGEMAKRLDVPASTLRYYDKEGLLPFVARSPGGMRMFQDADLEWLKVIGCLKKAGMSIKNIRVYIELAMQGDETIDQRLELFQNQREVLRTGWRSCRRPWRRWNTSAGSTRPPRRRGRWQRPRA